MYLGTVSIPLADLRAAFEKIKQYRVPPLRVSTQEQADVLTAQDPTGRKWTVGEEYYLVPRRQLAPGLHNEDVTR